MAVRLQGTPTVASMPFHEQLWGSYGWLSAGVIDSEMLMLYGCPAFASGAVGDGNWIMVMHDWLTHRADRYAFPGISADIDWSSIEVRINAECAGQSLSVLYQAMRFFPTG